MNLFEHEEQIIVHARAYLESLGDGEPAGTDEYKNLLREYVRMLKIMRTSTKVADRVAGGLGVERQELLGQVNNDALTGLFNRRFMEEALPRSLRTLSRSAHHAAVLMLDIDFFKKYNDTYGHSGGDECLRLVAKALADGLVRDDDFVCRYGGEEFLVFLPNTEKAGAVIIAERIFKNVRELKIPHEKSDVADCVTISVGVTSGMPKEADAKRFIDRADAALYMSKSGGRNRYTYLDLEG